MDLLREKTQSGRIGKFSGFTKYRSFDSERLFAQVYYMGGKFIIERSFPNTLSGRDDLRDFLKKFKKDEDILSHLKVKGKITMNIEKIVEEMKTQRAFAEEVIEGSDPSTQSFRIGRKRSAKESLERLGAVYKDTLKKNMIAVIINGSESEAFAKQAKDGIEMPTVEYMSLINDISKGFSDDHLNGKSTVLNLILGLNESLNGVYDSLGIDGSFIEYDPRFERVINTRDDLDTLILDVIRTQVGEDLLALYVVEKAANAAMDMFYDGKRFAFGVTAPTAEIADLANASLTKAVSNAFVVVAGRQSRGLKTEPVAKIKEVTEETVMGALGDMRKAIKD